MTQELRHKRSIELNHFMMPNMCYLQFDYRKSATLSTLFAYVPIDDTHHYHYFSMRIRTRLPEIIDKLIFGFAAWIEARIKVDRDKWFGRKTQEILSGKLTFDQTDKVRLQDTVICVGQGPIQDRSAERLGRSDAGVILLRKIWKRELRLMAEGKPLTQFASPRFEASGKVATLDLPEGADALSDPPLRTSSLDHDGLVSG